MDNEPNNNQSNSPKPTNDLLVNCTKCKKNPCICSGADNVSRQKTSTKKTKRTTPPKISWI